MTSQEEWTQAVHRIRQAQAHLRETWTSGAVPVEEEIAMRAKFAELLSNAFEVLGDKVDLDDSIEHLETIVRRLGPPSPARAEYLDKLSYSKMSAFKTTNSARDLDEAIKYGQQARDEVDPTDRALLSRIHHNLGYNLSHRAQLGPARPSDLDEAIDCGQMVLDLAAPDSEEYAGTLMNLVSRFQARFERDHREEDRQRALALIQLRLERDTPETLSYVYTRLAQSRLAHLGSDDIDGIDDGIARAKDVLRLIPLKHEGRTDVLKEILSKYERRYRKSNQRSDLIAAMVYSGHILEAVPPGYPRRLDWAVQHLALIAELASSSQSIAELDDLVEQARRLREEIPNSHAKRHPSGLAVGAIIAQKYLLEASRQLPHASRPRDQCQEPDSSPVRVQAAEKVHAYFTAAYQDKKLLKGLASMQAEHGLEIEILAKNAKATEPLSNIDLNSALQQKTDEAHAKLSLRQKDPGSRPRHKYNDYHDQLTGLRNLALDKSSGRIIMQMEEIVKDMMGYTDTEEPKSWTEHVERESRLEREFLEREQLEGKHPNANLCRVCRAIQIIIGPKLPDEGYSWNSKLFLPHGNWSQLQCRRHCGVCRLIISLITTAQGTLHPRLAELDREIQGVQFHLRKLPSGESMLGVEYGLKLVGGIRLLTPGNLDALRQNHSTGKQLVDTTQLRRWLNNCDYNHGRICNGVLSDLRFSQDINLILVDVRDRCLIRATSAEKYFALSYVWGDAQMPSLRQSTLEARLKPQSLNEKALDLPTTIVDAMLLVESLGERYLWVDGLCIIEDDEGDKTQNVNTMDIIYGKSFATIMAIHGTDANAGLPGVRPNSRTPQHMESIRVSRMYRDHLGYEAGLSSDTTEDITVVATPTPLELALEASTWKSRGWIFQEALLSRRRLYFTKDWVYFQCNKETHCESPLVESGHAEFLDRQVSLVSSTKPKNPLMELKQSTSSSAERDLRQTFGIYKELVEIYTPRRISLANDIIRAFSGILSVMAEFTNQRFENGLPTSLFDVALFWCPVEPLFRRSSSEFSYRTNLATVASLTEMSRKHGIKYRLTPAKDEPPSLFPSWSWAGWVGPVEYRLTNVENEPLPTSSVDTFHIYHHGHHREIHTHRASTSQTTPEPTSQQPAISTPDLGPHTLQFWARTVPASPFFHLQRNSSPDYLSIRQNQLHSEGQQLILRIYDRQNRHCGIWYAILKDDKLLGTELSLDMVEISRLGDVYKRREGPSRVEGEVDLFDRGCFPDTGPGSGLVNVVVVRWDHEVAERYTVAQVHVAAWEEAGPVWGHVRLA
ncbi:HET-domain-containing protein [Aspergillus taichungensis]|uniref:HET-domain-containing protein n=1 Tax=Aspergillus taichungensis TaxID=482145 RepID=A0A2J5I901_9EURO|nr:HET-domain-containing protein [Aspergillus taichungensis]